MALTAFSSGKMPVTATREASSMQMWTLAGSLEPVAFTGSIPAHPAPVALTRAITHCPAGDCLQSPRGGDPVANPLKTPKFLDVEVDQAARFLIFIAHNRFWWGPGLSSATGRPVAKPG